VSIFFSPPRGLRPLASGFLALGLLAGAVPATAVQGEIEGVRFAERARAGGQVLELRSLGVLRWRALFKAYVAALYVEPGHAPSVWRSDVPKRLEIEYFWPIAAPDFGTAAERILADSLPAGELDGLRQRLARFHAAYEDVEPGDRYALTYVPGLGTELAKNGEPRVRVPGSDFAAAYFSIFLGPEPVDGSLRDQLLGRR
jgi:Chalcone isomerase-like